MIRRLTRLRRAALLPLLVIGAALAPADARASSQQIAIIQDGADLKANPAGTLSQMRALGATTVRVVMYWYDVAPHSGSTSKPHFDASDPNAYPARDWTTWDAIVRDAHADGMRVLLDLAGGSPRWASGAGAPKQDPYFAWKPNAGDYGQFVQAVGRRYSGSFRPKGVKSALPRVSLWSLWNEPNFGEDLGPQAIDTSRISYAPQMYRHLLQAGWSALARTGHTTRHDTILIGELAAHGMALSEGRHGPGFEQGLPGNYGQTQPLPFLRTLYCLSGTGEKLTGYAASSVGCPTNAAGRARFRAQNPALFQTQGVADHPYANSGTPLSDGKGNPNWSTFPNLPLLANTIDEANRAYGSHDRPEIYNDEYGYITDPPQRGKDQAVSTANAARYINWAEYISWASPRVASYSQYLLADPLPSATGNGGFASGLYFSNDKPKPSLDAYRMPLWVPSTRLSRPGPDKVWGEARPAHWTGLLTHRTPSVQIQFQAHGRGRWTTIETVHANTYFEVRPRLTTSGNLRLRFTYPIADDPFDPLGIAGSSIVSRTQAIVVR